MRTISFLAPRILLLAISVVFPFLGTGCDVYENHPRIKLRLQNAIDRGLEPGGDLAKELSEIRVPNVSSEEDAKAICRALAQMPLSGEGFENLESPLHHLVNLFQFVESDEVPAYEILSSEGVPELIRILDLCLGGEAREDDSDLLFLLRILALYGSKEGAEKVVECARLSLGPESYIWARIFDNFEGSHSYRDYVFGAMKENLPEGFIAVALLDSANALAIAGEPVDHPFDSPEGIQRIRSWLEDPDPGTFSYAHSATAAIPFVVESRRGELLELASGHASPRVRMEAAWARAELGQEAGVETLVEFCLDPKHSSVAQIYLEELGKTDRVPGETKGSEFLAISKFADWLDTRKGRPPDDLEVVDRRSLRWPPGQESKPFFLVRYRMRDQTGLEADIVDYGLGGGDPWCLFDYRMNERPAEDVYAIYCYREMEGLELIEISEVYNQDEYKGIVAEWDGEELQDVDVTGVAEISPRLNYAGERRVVIADASRGGEKGWAVFDGPDSEWYPESDFPEESEDVAILDVHVGRKLLGFTGDADRKKFLTGGEPEPAPAKFVEAYERLLDELDEAEGEPLVEMFGGFESLADFFEKYVKNLAETSGVTETSAVLKTYERILARADKVDGPDRKEVFDAFSILGDRFESYVDALVDAGRGDEIIPLISRFEPYWDRGLGRRMIGNAAFKAGDLPLAERHLVHMRNNLENFGRLTVINVLAEVLVRQGKEVEARELLIDCMNQIRKEFTTLEDPSSQRMFSESYTSRRDTFLRLFPEKRRGSTVPGSRKNFRGRRSGSSNPGAKFGGLKPGLRTAFSENENRR